MRAHARELVALSPDLILVQTYPALTALRQTTSTVPCVFVQVSDPVGGGFVKSLAHPGGNLTGFTNFEPEMGGKWLEVLKEMRPTLCGRWCCWRQIYRCIRHTCAQPKRRGGSSGRR